MSDKELLHLKKEVRSLLIPAKNGLTPQQLENDYLEMVGSRLPLRGLGYRSTMDMVRDMPDVVDVCSTHDGHFLLKGIPDETTKGIANLVARQKPTKPSRLRYSHHKTRASCFNSYSKLPRRSRTAPMLPAVVKSELKDLLSFSPVLLSNFDHAYRHRFGRDFQYIRYGFYSMFEVLHAASDIITVQQTRAGSLLVLKSSHMINSGRMYKNVEQQHGFSSLLGKTPIIYPLPWNRGVTTNLSTATLQFGHLKGCDTLNKQENNATFGPLKNESMLYMQVQNSPLFTQKQLVTHNLQPQRALNLQKHEVALVSPGQPLIKELVPPYIQKPTLTSENQRSVVLPSLQMQTFTSVTQEKEVVDCKNEQKMAEIYPQMNEKPPSVMEKTELTLCKPAAKTAVKCSEGTFSSLRQGQASPPCTPHSGTHYDQDLAPPIESKMGNSHPVINEVKPNSLGLMMTHLKTQNEENLFPVNFNVNHSHQGPVIPSEAQIRETVTQVKPMMSQGCPQSASPSYTQKRKAVPSVDNTVTVNAPRSVTLSEITQKETLLLDIPVVNPSYLEPVNPSEVQHREAFPPKIETCTLECLTPLGTHNKRTLPPVNHEMAFYSQGQKFPGESQKVELLHCNKVEATLNLQDCSVTPSIKKSDLPPLELTMLPTVAQTKTPDLPAVRTTEYFVWKLQKLEEEMKISLAKKGPGGTVEAELKEKIRFKLFYRIYYCN